MISASKRMKQIPQWELKVSVSAILTTSTSWNRSGIRRPIYVRRILNFNKLLLYPLQGCRSRHQINCVTSSSVKISWIWPFLAILSNPIGNYQLVPLSSQASSSEEEVVDEVLNQILSDIEINPSSSKEICTFYIEKMCRAKNLSVAARLLQSLRDKQIFLNLHAYNLLLAAAGEENDVDLVSQVFKDVLFSNESISSTSFLNLAKAFAKTPDSVLLLRFVREVSELTFPRSVAVVNRIIFAFAEYGQVDKALLVFNHVKNLKCKPDLVTYNTVLGILGRTSRIDEMLHEFGSMKEAKIDPDIISYNTLLNSLRKVGRLDLCLAYWKEMGERGVKPDLRTYTAMIESFGRSGNVEESLRLFDEMKLKKIRPSIYIYRSLINYLKKMGKLELAMSFAEEMKACLPDLVNPKDFKRKDR